MIKLIFLSIFLSLSSCAQAEPTVPIEKNQLPVGPSTLSAAVYQMKYSSAGRHVIQVSYQRLNGDKFLSTQGIAILDEYYFSENWGVQAGLGFYKSTIVPEAETSIRLGVTPAMYDPDWMLRAMGVYQPVYGKLAWGDSIQHFKWSLRAGFFLAHLGRKSLPASESSSLALSGGAPSKSSKFVVGPAIGTALRFPFRRVWSLGFEADAFLQSKLVAVDQTKGTFRTVWNLGIGLGFQL